MARHAFQSQYIADNWLTIRLRVVSTTEYSRKQTYCLVSKETPVEGIMKWFKFYGQDYLVDTKMMSLRLGERALWLTLLCLYSANGGKPIKVTEATIKHMSGINVTDDEWSTYDGFLALFEQLGMITNDNNMITITAFHRRQTSQLSGYERLKKYREKKKSLGDDDNKNDNVGDNANDNARIDKKRRDKRINPPLTGIEQSLVDNLPPEDMEAFAREKRIRVRDVVATKEAYVSWVQEKPGDKNRHGRNLRATVFSWINRDIREGKLQVEKSLEDMIREEVPHAKIY